MKRLSGQEEPYGLVHSETKNDTKAPTNPLKFAAEYLDPTGLYHLRARQYDPTTGRFTTTDPLPARATAPYVSTYAYANGRPTALTDPSGMGASGDTCGSISCWFRSPEGHHDLACSLAAAGVAAGVADVPIALAGAAEAVKAGAEWGSAVVSHGAAMGTIAGGSFVGAGLLGGCEVGALVIP